MPQALPSISILHLGEFDEMGSDMFMRTNHSESACTGLFVTTLLRSDAKVQSVPGKTESLPVCD
jgi:hypothetical protein